MLPSALQSFNTTTVSSKVPAHAGSRACDAQRPAPSACVHRAQGREMPASTHRVRSMKELGPWEGTSARKGSSHLSATLAPPRFGVVRLRMRGREPAFLFFAFFNNRFLRIARVFDGPAGVKAALHTKAWVGGISVRYFYSDDRMADKAGPSASAASSSTSNIDITTPAIVEWDSSDILFEATFDARRLDASNNAFFKLRRTVTLKATAPAKTPLFVFIHPERIKSLEVVEVAAAESGVVGRYEEARKKLGSDAVCLRFVLTQLADLVGPKSLDLTPKNKASGTVLDSLRSLARHDSIAVYFPRNVVSRARLTSLCEVANSGMLSSIARQAELTSLYRGKGGQVIAESDTYVDASVETNSPPSYDELGPGPPLAPFQEFQSPLKKRRRRSSEDVASARIGSLDIERLCREIVDEQKAEMLKQVEEQQNKLYDRLIADLKPYIGEELQKLEYRILDHVEQRSGKQAEEQDEFLEQRLEEVQDEINDTIESRVHDVDEKVEEEFYGLRARLEEFIEEEMAQAEDRMVEHLQNSATISLQFN